jgi:peroxiredoxin
MKKIFLSLISLLLADFVVQTQQFEGTNAGTVATSRDSDAGTQQIQDKSDEYIYELCTQESEQLTEEIAIAKAAVISKKVDIAIKKAYLLTRQTQAIMNKGDMVAGPTVLRELAKKILLDENNNDPAKLTTIRQCSD